VIAAVPQPVLPPYWVLLIPFLIGLLAVILLLLILYLSRRRKRKEATTSGFAILVHPHV
jgi:hypothetical protein